MADKTISVVVLLKPPDLEAVYHGMPVGGGSNHRGEVLLPNILLKVMELWLQLFSSQQLRELIPADQVEAHLQRHVKKLKSNCGSDLPYKRLCGLRLPAFILSKEQLLHQSPPHSLLHFLHPAVMFVLHLSAVSFTTSS